MDHDVQEAADEETDECRNRNGDINVDCDHSCVAKAAISKTPRAAPSARRPAASPETVHGGTARDERGNGGFTSANANTSEARVKQSGVCSKAIGARSEFLR